MSDTAAAPVTRKEPEYIVGAPTGMILTEQFAYLEWHSRECRPDGECFVCQRFALVRAALMTPFARGAGE